MQWQKWRIQNKRAVRKKRTLIMIKNNDGKPACQLREKWFPKTINSDRQTKMDFKRYMTECAVITQAIGSNVAVVVVVWTKKNATIFYHNHWFAKNLTLH